MEDRAQRDAKIRALGKRITALEVGQMSELMAVMDKLDRMGQDIRDIKTDVKDTKQELRVLNGCVKDNKQAIAILNATTLRIDVIKLSVLIGAVVLLVTVGVQVIQGLL